MGDDGLSDLFGSIAVARREIAASQARLASLCVAYAEGRRAQEVADRGGGGGSPRVRVGEFVADEVSVVLGVSPWEARCLVARSRRVARSLPEVAAAAVRGELDADRVREIDRVARLVVEPATLVAIDEGVVTAAGSRTVRQLRAWLERLVARCEPAALTHRHRVSFADRRVTVAQSVTGMGYVTGEVSGADAAAIDLRLSGLARGLGAGDDRSEAQRRSDLFAGLLLGTVQVCPTGPSAMTPAGLEVEHIDPDTGEFLGTTVEPVDADGEPVGFGELAGPDDRSGSGLGSEWWAPAVVEAPTGPVRVGVVVGLSSLLGVDESPGELLDRSGMVPAEVVRDIAGRSSTLFTRLLVDDVGGSPGDGSRLVDVSELGRFASAALSELVRVRAGTCVFPTCSVSAARCDVDHHDPFPQGPTSAANLDPLCRRHHRGKTFAGLAARRDLDAVEWTFPTADTYRCVDDPLPLPILADVLAA